MKVFLTLILFSAQAFAVLPVVDLSTVPPKAATTNQSLIFDAPGPNPGPGYQLPYSNGQAKIRVGSGAAFTDVAYTDLIIAPLLKSAHVHCFFGNVKGSIATATQADLNSGESSNDGGIENQSSYWFPCLIDTRTNSVVPFKVRPIIYYNGPLAERWFDDGMELLMGRASNTDTNDWYLREKKIIWECNGVGSALIPLICGEGQLLRLKLIFPNCGDGRLKSTDHYSHMAYAGYYANGDKLTAKDTLPNQCPRSHPIRYPDLSFILGFRMNDANMINYVRASSDHIGDPAGISIHGDAKEKHGNAFKVHILKNCLQARMDCGGKNIGQVDGVYKVLGEVN